MRTRLVVFVCTANQCRSPMAERLLVRRLGGESEWKVVSAGTSTIDGLPASSLAEEVMREAGMDLDGHSTRRVTSQLMRSASVVITMTAAQKRQLIDEFPEAGEKVYMLKEVGTDPDPGDVADPVGSTAVVYRGVRDEIDALMPDVVLFLHGLK